VLTLRVCTALIYVVSLKTEAINLNMHINVNYTSLSFCIVHRLSIAAVVDYLQNHIICCFLAGLSAEASSIRCEDAFVLFTPVGLGDLSVPTGLCSG